MHGRSCKQYIFWSCNTLLPVLRVLMKILSHATWKRKQKSWRVSNFALLIVVFKWHHGSEGVNIRHSHVWSRLPKIAVSWKLCSLPRWWRTVICSWRPLRKARGKERRRTLMQVKWWPIWCLKLIPKIPDFDTWINQKTPDFDAGKMEVSCFWFYG